MIAINHHAQVYLLYERWWSICWKGLLDIPVKFLPIVTLKSGVINMKVSRAKMSREL
jgi:hypothetical protein